MSLGLSDVNTCAYNQHTKVLHVPEKERKSHFSHMTKEETDSYQEAVRASLSLIEAEELGEQKNLPAMWQGQG